jgi:hypothetical protein
MIGTWEIRVFGVDPTAQCKVRAQRVYRFTRSTFTEASQAAKDRARAEGLTAPCVWAATRLPSDYEDSE